MPNDPARSVVHEIAGFPDIHVPEFNNVGALQAVPDLAGEPLVEAGGLFAQGALRGCLAEGQIGHGAQDLPLGVEGQLDLHHVAGRILNDVALDVLGPGIQAFPGHLLVPGQELLPAGDVLPPALDPETQALSQAFQLLLALPGEFQLVFDEIQQHHLRLSVADDMGIPLGIDAFQGQGQVPLLQVLPENLLIRAAVRQDLPEIAAMLSPGVGLGGHKELPVPG